MFETNLHLSIGGLPPLSARGCSEVLRLAPLGEMKRTINGELIFIGEDSIKKYSCLIKGKDKAPPALEGLTRGQKVTVGCLSYLTQKFISKEPNQTVALERDPIPHSLYAFTSERNAIDLSEIKKRTVTFSSSLPEGQEIYLSYRPQLEMIVIDLGTETDEWNLTCGWYLKLEEI